MARLERLATQQSALPELRMSDAQWNEPRLTVRVRHLAGASYLRHATVRSLRFDLVDSALEPVFAPLDNFDVLYTGARLYF